MNSTPGPPPARVLADVFWHTGHSLPGVLRLEHGELVLERPRGQGSPVRIPVQSIDRADLETTFGMVPALAVWHRVEGREVCSRFAFGHEDDNERQDDDFGLADRMGPGLAREAAGRLEGGLRALTGGINRGMRTARQAVEGLTRIEEYEAWPTAITEAKASLRGRAAAKADTAPIKSAGSLVHVDIAFPVGNAETRYAWFREHLVPLLMACGGRARELGVRGAPVIQPDYPLDSPICRIVVAGEFSRGKSTVINALFGIHGEIALPTGMTPTTPLACAIRVPRVGETDGATISYRMNRPERALSIEEFRAGVRLAEGRGTAEAEQTAELHLSEARRVEVRITGAYLPAGVEIEDTPGLNEQAGRSAGALAALGRADLVLFVLAADQLLGDLERDVINNTLAAGRHRNVLFLINFWDTIDDDTQKASLLRRATAVLGSFPTPFHGPDAGTGMPHVFTIAALSASRAQRRHQPAPEDSGIPALRARLRELLGPGSQSLLLRARVGRALRYCALLREAISSAAANAQAAAEGRTDVPAAGRKGAAAAAARVIEGLESAVEGAISRPLALLGEGDMPVGPGAERARMAAVRVAMGDVTRAAGEARDFVLAQVRAAYLTRGVPAPSLDAPIDSPIDVPPPAGPDEPISAYRERASRLARETLSARTKAAQVSLTAALGTTEPARRPPDGAETRSRVSALHLLEEDILRLERVLPGGLG